MNNNNFNENKSLILNKYDSKKDITIIFIHGLGGWEDEFYSIIEYLKKSKFKDRINIILNSRKNTGFKTIEEQAQEVYFNFKKHLKGKKKHKIILVGHSQGGAISLLLVELLKNANQEVVGLLLVGTPLGGINYVKEFIELNKQEYPNIIHLLEEGVLGFKLENNPQGVLDLMQENLFPIINKTNNLIKENGIITKTVIGIKPSEIEYPASLKSFIPIIPSLIKNNLINYNAIFHNLLSKISLKTLFDFKKVITKGSLFNSEEFTGSLENDLLISKENQKWPHKNKFIEEIISNEVVHNWKISILVSKHQQERIKAELESEILKETIEKLISQIIKR